ncbi:MAG: DUF3365 domain-containing protein [Gammaproteobacteria bacterium]|nr:DUF3365 domain-containing protein [Gammaproteobacteria bacterium]
MKILLPLILGSVLMFDSALAADADIESRVAASKQVVQAFFGELKGELVKAMKQGGPVNAIQACNVSAPAIAQAASEKHNMTVGRTSLRLRNPDNSPDAWEAGVLAKFEERRAAGESPAKMAYFEVVENDGVRTFRFMKAIGMPPLSKMPCLKCHGREINPKVAAKLDALYPADNARGYRPGQIRGAFTISQPM